MVYYGGVEHEIRKEVWPFLLGHYKFGMDKKDMAQVKKFLKLCSVYSTWLLTTLVKKYTLAYLQKESGTKE